MYQTSGQYHGSRRKVLAMSHRVSPSFTTYSFGAPEASGTCWLTGCMTGRLCTGAAATLRPASASIEDEPLGIVAVRGAGGGASASSSLKGLNLSIVAQPPIRSDNAAIESVRLDPRRFLSGDIIGGRSITVVRVCPLAGRCYNMSCRRRSGCQTRHNSGPNRVWQPKYCAALSAILFNKVKNLGGICRVLR